MKSPITVAALACIFLTLPVVGTAQTHEILLSSTENAYNPIASPDGKYIAFVRTGRWSEGSGGFGRSNLRSEVAFMDADGNVLTGDSPLAASFKNGFPTPTT
jgi:WD40-like Beta Propeller Repeat